MNFGMEFSFVPISLMKIANNEVPIRCDEGEKGENKKKYPSHQRKLYRPKK